MIESLLSLFGPAYFGYRHTPYIAVIIWACSSAAIFLWSNRDSLQYARRHAYGADSVPSAYTGFVTVLLFISIAVVFLAVHSALYFLVGKFV